MGDTINPGGVPVSGSGRRQRGKPPHRGETRSAGIAARFCSRLVLAQRFRLDASEKNMIMAALGGDFLCNAWPRSFATSGSGQESEPDAGGWQPPQRVLGRDPTGDDENEFRDEENDEFHADLDEDEHAMWAGAEEEAQSALAAMEQAKRTL